MRRIHSNTNHTIDSLFAVGLFAIFALTAFMTIIIGASVYKNINTAEQSHSTASTALSYISEKVRQNDSKDAISLQTLEDLDVLCLTQEYNQKTYITYIYYWKNQLCEQLLPASAAFVPKNGKTLLNVADYSISASGSGFTISVVDDQHKTSTLYLAPKAN